MNKAIVGENVVILSEDEKKKMDKIEVRNQALILKVRKGDQAAINELCRVNERFIYNVMLLKTRNNKALSEDLTQDTLVKMVANLHKYVSAEFKFRSWLSTIIKSVFIDNVRREAARIEHVSNSVDFSEMGADGDGYKTDKIEYNMLKNLSVEQEYIKSENTVRMKQIIMEGIESLSNTHQKKAIVLNLFEDLSYNEISEKLEVSLDKTKVLIFRAKQGILKNIVQKNYHMAGGILNQVIVQESVLMGKSAAAIAKEYEMEIEEVEEILEKGLKKVYRFKFYGEGVAA